MADWKGSAQLMTISRFSQRAGISRKTLIYYDSIDLLKPVFVKDNGYRCYVYSQLDDVSIIHALKELGIPLKEIKAYLEDIDSEKLVKLLETQRLKVQEELERLSQMQDIIEQRIGNMPLLSTLDCTQLQLVHAGEEPLLLGPLMQLNDDTLDDDFLSFMDFAKSRHVLSSYPLGVLVQYADASVNAVDQYQYYYRLQPASAKLQTASKPAGLYVVGYHNSYLATALTDFTAWEAFMAEQGVAPTGPVYIENLTDEIITRNPEKHYAKVSVQVAKSL